MKYIVVICDGMADFPIKALNNKTPLQCANKPNIDYLAQNGIVGLVKTIPSGMEAGSDVANLNIMGYNPKLYYTGRSPLEAISMGIDLNENDIAFRCNLVTLSDKESYYKKLMIDYSADEITSEEASYLIDDINTKFKNEYIEFFSGISYRHCMIWRKGPQNLNLTPPHNISNQKIENYIPLNKYLSDMMIKSYDILNNHIINLNRLNRNLNPANSIWLWGEGKKVKLPSFYNKYKLKGSVISAVDLIKGIGICAGLNCLNVEGVTGNINTNFVGKSKKALDELIKNDRDFVYIHIEAPDECSHRGETQNKLKSIELIDNQIIASLIKTLNEASEDYSILLMPDHFTPLALKLHTCDPVPFIIYRSNKNFKSGLKGYDEAQAKLTKIYIDEGYKLMDKFIKGEK